MMLVTCSTELVGFRGCKALTYLCVPVMGAYVVGLLAELERDDLMHVDHPSLLLTHEKTPWP